MTERVDIAKLIDSSRAFAERTRVDMEAANNALNAIRATAADNQNPFDLWTAIDEQIGKATEPALRRQLIEFRSQFETEMFITEAARVESSFRQGPDAGWNAWLLTLAEGITRFRFRFSTRLCEHPFPFQESANHDLENIRKAVRSTNQGRWPEAYDPIEYLANQAALPDAIQARLFVILGQIQLYHFLKPAAAKELFDSAAILAPDDAKVLSALGDYFVGENDIQSARRCYERAIHNEPGIANAYAGMGECSEKENLLEAAEGWYKKAIAAAGGDSLGYSKLLKLYSRPEYFKSRESSLADIIQAAVAIDPEGEYQTYLDCAYAYEQNQDFEKAQRWYQKAIALDVTRPSGYAMLGQCYEKQQRYDQAQAAYKKALEVAPECYDGYWGLTVLYEQLEKWQDALECYKRAPQHREEWARIARAKVGEMLWRLGEDDEAEETLIRELQADKANDSAKNVLQMIADDYYQKRDDRGNAVRLYGEMLRALGESYRADYHNRIGNMKFYYGENAEAAQEYQLAIAAMPEYATFHRNLGGACKSLKDYAQAAREFETAFELDRDKKSFNREMALLMNAEANDHYAQGNYAEAIELYEKAIEFDPADDVLQSNLAGAWEQSKEPGKRLEALDHAREAFDRAQAVAGVEKYQKDIERISRKREFTAVYGERAIDWLHVVTPIAVEVAADLVALTEGSTKGSLSDDVSRHVADMRTRIHRDFGLKIPGVRFRGNEGDLSEGTYIMMITEIPVATGNIAIDKRFFPGPAEGLSRLGLKGDQGTNPLPAAGNGFWINKDDWRKVEAEGLELWDVIEYPIRHLEAVTQRNLVEFVGHQEVLGIVEIELPRRIDELRASPAKLTALTAVCRALVAEGASITPFAEIYDTFERLYHQQANLQNIVESIRSLPAVRSRLPGNDTRYSILELGSRWEAEVRNSIYQFGSHSLLAIEAEPCQKLLSAFRNSSGWERDVVAIVDDPELRPFVRLLIEIEFPNVPVLSRRELRSDLEFKTVGSAELEEATVPPRSEFSNRRWVGVSGDPSESKGAFLGPIEIGITVFLNEAVIGAQAGADDMPTAEILTMMRDGLFYELGMVLPEVRVEIDNSLNKNEFRFRLNGRESATLPGLEQDQFLVNETVDRLRLLGINGVEAVNPANGNACAIVRAEEASSGDCREAGLTTWGTVGFLVLTLAAEIRKSAATFQTVNATQYILDSLSAAFPDLISTALKRFSVEEICLVLRDLLDEGISIRDLRSILEGMLSVNGTTDVDLDRYIVFSPRTENLCPVFGGRGINDLTPAEYSNFVRTCLKSYISHKYTKGGSTLVVYLLDREIERRISR
ncbi:MAG TPA: FHIPEP family type III secretion protein, partial [Blastocatellia bacterium]|nr:FHIPEP family type III secretion protein [Blastocatellia bacterium]